MDAKDESKGHYMLFAWDGYYPCGGSDDYYGRFATIEDATKQYHNGLGELGMKYECHEILDLETGEWVK